MSHYYGTKLSFSQSKSPLLSRRNPIGNFSFNLLLLFNNLLFPMVPLHLYNPQHRYNNNNGLIFFNLVHSNHLRYCIGLPNQSLIVKQMRLGPMRCSMDATITTSPSLWTFLGTTSLLLKRQFYSSSVSYIFADNIECIICHFFKSKSRMWLSNDHWQW